MSKLKNFDKTVSTLSKLGIYFDDRSTSNIETILSSIRSMVIKYHIEGVVIDYLQILTINKKSSNVEEAIAAASQAIKEYSQGVQYLDTGIVAIIS